MASPDVPPPSRLPAALPPPSPELARVHKAAEAGDVPGLTAALGELQQPEQEIDALVLRSGESIAQAALHRAAAAGRETPLKLLLLHGAERDLADSAGRTPLICAAGAGADECVAVLLSGGVVRSVADAAGRTALHAAAAAGRQRVVWQLLNERVAVDARDAGGATPLHLAAAAGVCGSVPILRALLSAGAPMLAVDWRGRTPRQVAEAGSHAAAALYLMAVEATTRAAPGHPTRTELLATAGDLADIYRVACEAERAGAPGGEVADALAAAVRQLLERQGQAEAFIVKENFV